MNLYPFVGIEDGKMHMYVSPFRLNKVGPMHSRGKPIPDDCANEIDPNNVENALAKMNQYFNEANKAKKK